MGAEARWTRLAFVRRTAGIAAGLLLAREGGSAVGLLADDAGAAPAADTHSFVSRRDLVPPAITVVHRGGGTAEGLLFLAPSSGPGQRGALIVDDTGEPVWFRPSQPVTAMNFRTAVYRGKPVLTWWQGKTERGLGEGTHVILDASYREIARLPAGHGRPSDLHEFLVTRHGTALVTSWEEASADLSSVGGPSRGTVVGGVIQELELPSGRVLFEWRSLDHVGIDESHTGFSAKAPYDYFHINSIELASDGNLLVSARNTWAVYKIDRGSGDVIWRLGGRKSDFAMGPGTTFAWQHDAREHDGNLISLFDDGAAPQVQPQSKGLVLAVDTKRMRATLHRKYTHRPPVLAHALGSVQVLPNGNVLVGWGTSPYFTEYDKAGHVVLDAKLPHGGQNYRVLRLPWAGHPSTVPSLAAHDGHTAYASWNGATEVAAWRLETGPAASSLDVDGTTPKAGFETALPVSPGSRYAAVTALDRHGKPLQRSKTIRLT